ncbi:MAG: hypothetical protein KDE46_19220, partial [Caldilineaceae bacterium]|nr:hypothetical protein [Caldilineaceae bacterium]
MNSHTRLLLRFMLHTICVCSILLSGLHAAPLSAAVTFQELAAMPIELMEASVSFHDPAFSNSEQFAQLGEVNPAAMGGVKVKDVSA